MSGTSLINSLGGTAGFGEQVLERGDDLASASIDFLSVFENGLNFYGVTYETLWVNTNGTVSFSGPMTTSVPVAISASTPAGIFPFWTDIDTRNPVTLEPSSGGTSQGTNLVYYDLDKLNDRLVITWDDVGYFPSSNDHVNAFQLILQDRSSEPGRSPGDFDIELRYEWIDWTSGNYFSEAHAHAGFSAGDGEHFFELPQSGDPDALLELENSLGNTNSPGHWLFDIRNGSLPQNVTIRSAPDNLEGDAGASQMVFTVERTGETSGTLTLDWIAAGTSAHPARPGDVTTTLPLSGSIFFAEGQTERRISISIEGDTYAEYDESLVVSIANPVSSNSVPVILERQFATGIILDDDTPAPPALSDGPSAYFVGSSAVSTFDGLLYGLHAVGEFTLCQFQDGGPFEIQLRTEATGGSTSAATSVAINVQGHRITLDPVRSVPLYVDGVRTAIDTLQGPLSIGDTGALLYQDGNAFTLVLPAGDQFVVSLDPAGFVNLSAHLSPDRMTEDISGLWGNANQVSSDDLETRTGAPLDMPTSQHDFTGGFLNEWRIEDTFSHFDRRSGETTASWQDWTFEYRSISVSDLPDDVLQRSASAVAFLDDFSSELLEMAMLDFAMTGRLFFLESISELGLTPSKIAQSLPIFSQEAVNAVMVSNATGNVSEGQSGTTELMFWIDRFGDLSVPLDVSYTISGDVLRSDLVNTPMAGSLRFTAGQSRLYFTVQVAGDSLSEIDETVTFSIATTDAVLLNTSASALILDDDSIPMLTGTSSRETLSGDAGSNVLFGLNGTDILLGHAGDDALFGGSGNDSLDGGSGADFLDGGGGQDTASYIFSSGRVMVDLQNDAYDFGDAVGDTYVSIEIFRTGRGADQLRGDERGNIFYTGAFSDRLYGRAGEDFLFGETGADAFYGGLGADQMTAGEGEVRDRFIYFSVSETGVGEGNRDIILDFQPGEDRIEISRFDADVTRGFKQRFDFIGSEAFSGQAGELRYTNDTLGARTIVQGDTDGDMQADFEIELTGLLDLTAIDFLI